VHALERAGFEVVRIKGSAHIMRHANGRMVSVHVHKGETIKRGTVAGSGRHQHDHRFCG
jgi:predicted RNA binding protein YcfA (HicA-like mRNA interferase family)